MNKNTKRKGNYLVSGSFSIIAFFLLSIVELTAQADAIRTGVTFNWSDQQSSATEDQGILPTGIFEPATLESLDINGEVYGYFVAPNSYELTQLGPGGHDENWVFINETQIWRSNNPSYDGQALNAFQSRDLNQFIRSESPNIGITYGDYNSPANPNAQMHTIGYAPGIPVTADGLLLVTDSGGNAGNYIEVWGVHRGESTERRLGQTFVAQDLNFTCCGGVPNYDNFSLGGTSFFPYLGPPQPPLPDFDYWQTDRLSYPEAETPYAIGIAVYRLTEFAPVGATVTSIRFYNNVGPFHEANGKVMVMQPSNICDSGSSGFLDTDSDGVADICDLDDDNDGILDTSEENCLTEYIDVSMATFTSANPTLVDNVTTDYVGLAASGPGSNPPPSGGPYINGYDLDGGNDLITFTFNTPISIEVPASRQLKFIYEYYDNGGFPPTSRPLPISNAVGGIPMGIGEYTSGDNHIKDYVLHTSVGSITTTYELTIPQIQALDTGNWIELEIAYQLPLSAIPGTTIQVTGTEFILETSINGQSGFFDPSGAETYGIALRELSSCGTDTDGDGIIDIRDPDSDNDGCVDAIEAGHTDADGDGVLGNSPVTVDANGQVIGQGGYTGTHPRVTTVNQTVTIDAQPITQVSYEGGDETFTVATTGTGLQFQWEESQNGGESFTPISDNSIFSGTMTNTLTIMGVTTAMLNRQYRVVVTDPNNLCVPNMISSAAQLFVIVDIDLEACDPVPPPINIDFGGAPCPTVVFSENITGQDDGCPVDYIITRTWTITDCSSNVNVFTQVITLADTQAPTFVEALPGDATVSCDAVPPAEILTATDSCDPDITVTFDEQINDADSCPYDYTIVRTWSAADCAGNTIEHVQTITVEDTVAPTFVEALPSDATVSCDAVPAADTLTATDNCDPDIAVTFDEQINDPDSCPYDYTIIRTWSTADCSGNTLEHVQTITVEDTVAPTFVEPLPQDEMVMSCDDIPDAVVLTAVDNCDPDAQVTFVETSTGDGSCNGDFIITRTWTATDCSGNSTVHTQTVTVEIPIIPSPYEEEVTIMCDELLPRTPDLTFSGGCGGYDVVFTEDMTTDPDTGNHLIVRTWEVTDSCDTTATFTQNIFILQYEVAEITIDICVEDPEVNLLDYLPDHFTGQGIFTVVQGAVSLRGSLFNPTNLDIGQYLITYEEDNGLCENMANYTINVDSDCVPCNPEDSIERISTTITVNGDGINDYFEIEESSRYCDLRFDLVVFNRWGRKVFEQVDYQNDWGGTAPRGSIGNAGYLPTGTYYYIISITDVETGRGFEPINGYIYLGSN